MSDFPNCDYGVVGYCPLEGVKGGMIGRENQQGAHKGQQGSGHFMAGNGEAQKSGVGHGGFLVG